LKLVPPRSATPPDLTHQLAMFPRGEPAGCLRRKLRVKRKAGTAHSGPVDDGSRGALTSHGRDRRETGACGGGSSQLRFRPAWGWWALCVVCCSRRRRARSNLRGSRVALEPIKAVDSGPWIEQGREGRRGAGPPGIRSMHELARRLRAAGGRELARQRPKASSPVSRRPTCGFQQLGESDPPAMAPPEGWTPFCGPKRRGSRPERKRPRRARQCRRACWRCAPISSGHINWTGPAAPCRPIGCFCIGRAPGGPGSDPRSARTALRRACPRDRRGSRERGGMLRTSCAQPAISTTTRASIVAAAVDARGLRPAAFALTRWVAAELLAQRAEDPGSRGVRRAHRPPRASRSRWRRR